MNEQKLKLIEIINDLEADSSFNSDIENQESIKISIERLKKEFGVTQEELREELETR